MCPSWTVGFRGRSFTGGGDVARVGKPWSSPGQRPSGSRPRSAGLALGRWQNVGEFRHCIDSRGSGHQHRHQHRHRPSPNSPPRSSADCLEFQTIRCRRPGLRLGPIGPGVVATLRRAVAAAHRCPRVRLDPSLVVTGGSRGTPDLAWWALGRGLAFEGRCVGCPQDSKPTGTQHPPPRPRAPHEKRAGRKSYGVRSSMAKAAGRFTASPNRPSTRITAWLWLNRSPDVSTATSAS